MNNCPMCGVGSHSIWGACTLVYGVYNETTYHCNNCGASWKESEPVKITTIYEKMKYELESAYHCNDTDALYEILLKLLDVLDEKARRGV